MRTVEAIVKGLSSPRKVYRWFHRKLKKLDPLAVSDNDAKKFFDSQADANRKLLDYLSGHIETSKTIFDVGSNSGYFSKGVLDRKFTGTLFLFEPIAHLMSISVRTLASYNNPKVYVNSALGEAQGVLEIYLPDNSNIGWITLVAGKRTSDKCVNVTVDSTEYWAAKIYPDFVKIDVKGYELFILRPFLKVISASYRPSFLVELGWGKTNPNWPEFIEVAQQLIEVGYRFIDLSGEPIEISLEKLRELERTIDVLIEPKVIS